MTNYELKIKNFVGVCHWQTPTKNQYTSIDNFLASHPPSGDVTCGQVTGSEISNHG
jgi:hypothetical protein